MPESTFAGIITAIAASITALGGLIVVLTIFIPMLRTAKSTHKIVNQGRTDMQNYQRALIRALKAGGIEIPEDQSKSINGEPPQL
jgi:hypothetical protein